MRVVSDGPIGGVLRFDIPNIGVAGVGASEAVNAAIFPARRMMDGINTGAAIRNLESEAATVTCRLMADGKTMGEAVISLAGNGQSSKFINEIFSSANTDDFEGSVHCTAPADQCSLAWPWRWISTTGSSPPSRWSRSSNDPHRTQTQKGATAPAVAPFFFLGAATFQSPNRSGGFLAAD